MVFRDVVTEMTCSTIEPDGHGGFTSGKPVRRDIRVKASLNTSPEVASEYGLTSEQVLYVTSKERLDEEALFLYKGKTFQVRLPVADNSRFFCYTLIEVKGVDI